MEDSEGFTRPAFRVVTRPEGSRSALDVPSEGSVFFVRASSGGMAVSLLVGNAGSWSLSPHSAGTKEELNDSDFVLPVQALPWGTGSVLRKHGGGGSDNSPTHTCIPRSYSQE